MSDFRPAFVTPAFGRLDLSALVFDQRADAIRVLAEHGIEARCYVVADDANLELARERGFDVVERANDWLGARWNDGAEAAVLDGATHVVPIGSDSWLDPAYLLAVVPDWPGVSTGHRYAVLDELGERLALLRFGDLWGVGPHVIPRGLLREPYRPWDEDARSGCDGSLLTNLSRDWPGLAFSHVPWAPAFPAGYLGFRTFGNQLTPFESIAPTTEGTGLLEGREAWDVIAGAFPFHVAAARALFEARAAA